MSRYSRARYTSRRDRMRKHGRAWRLGAIAVGLSILVVLFLSWRDIYAYLKTYTY